MDNLTIAQLAEMSDEEIAAMSHLSPTDVPQEVPQATNGEVQPNGEPEDIDNTPQETDPTDNSIVVDDEVDPDNQDPQDGQSDADGDADNVDYQGFYSALTSPIKAAGREIKLETAEEAIRLIQMGADYSRKNEQHKKDRGVVKALEDRGINDPETLGFLADVHAGKPEAIAKLLDKHKVDLFDFDVEQGRDYVPQAAVTPAGVIALDDVLDHLRANSNTFDQTLGHINSWDDHSRSFVTRDPNLIRIIDEEVASGRFAEVDALIQRGKILGTISSDTPYLDAYQMCEKALTPAPQKEVVKVRGTRPKAQQTEKVDRNKVAVPGAAPSTNTGIPTLERLAQMSDDEVLNFKL